MKNGARISNGKVNRNARGDKTRARILSVAERLFSEHGIDGVSMRTLAARSKVNLAAVHYYFGSKEALFEAMFARRARVITEKRLKMLAECRADPERPPLINQILEAFLRPVLEDNREGGGRAYARIRTRLAAERTARARNLPSRFFDDSSHRFLDALADALPHLPAEELYWRFNIMLGAMYFTIANPARIEYLSKGLVDMSDENRKISYLVDFFARAFSADPLSAKTAGKRDKMRVASRTSRSGEPVSVNPCGRRPL